MVEEKPEVGSGKVEGWCPNIVSDDVDVFVRFGQKLGIYGRVKPPPAPRRRALGQQAAEKVVHDAKLWCKTKGKIAFHRNSPRGESLFREFLAENKG